MPEPANRTPLAVRRAGHADLAALSDLFDAYRGFYGQAPDPLRVRDYLAERLAREEAVAFLAEAAPAADDAIGATADADHAARPALGFTMLYPMFSSVSTGRVYILNDLFVASTTRRRGVGLALLTAARDFARERGALRLMLETARDNHAAQALYRRAGWSEEPTTWFQLPLQ